MCVVVVVVGRACMHVFSGIFARKKGMHDFYSRSQSETLVERSPTDEILCCF